MEKKLKIHVWGINYAPEQTGIAPYNKGMCEYLAERGHEVEMVSTFQYYPAWKKRPEDVGKLYRTERVNGVTLRRCYHFVPSKVSSLKRILHEGSFVFTSFLRLLFLPKPDVYIVVSPPLLLGAAAWLLGLIKRRPFAFHVQDLQPDAAVGLGMLKPGLFIKMLYALEAFGYRKAARVSGISDGMLDAYRRKGVPEEKILFFPNWVKLDTSRPPLRLAGFEPSFMRGLGLGDDAFPVVYSGNVGMKQGLEVLLDAAAVLDRRGNPKNVRILIVGEGSAKDALLAKAAQLDVKSVVFLPLQDFDKYQLMLAEGAMCLVTQQAGTGQYFFPSKLLSLLSAACPVLTVADTGTELVNALEGSGFGVNVEPGDPADLADALEHWAGRRDELRAMGEAGLAWVARFERERVLGEWERALQALARR